VHVIEYEPAGVMLALLSKFFPSEYVPFTTRSVAFVEAVGTAFAVPSVHRTIQQLSAVVVRVVEIGVVAAAVCFVLASGWPDCFTPVYDDAFPPIAVEELAEMTTLFAPDAGFRR